MSTVSHEASRVVPDKRGWFTQLLIREMWAGLAISVMWLAVLFAAVFGPDIVSTSAGTNTTTVPSAVAVALFAWLATRVVAKYGFGDQGTEAEPKR
jgi:dolichyl-phosphate-mannose--protein O-mannosyl transferase